MKYFIMHISNNISIKSFFGCINTIKYVATKCNMVFFKNTVLVVLFEHN